MKSILLIFGLSFSLLASAQGVKVKKKYLKSYEGVIPTYVINIGEEVVEVREEKIQISLTKDSLYIQVGKVISSGNYNASKEEKNQYTITGTMETTGIPVLLYVNTKSKEITRKGVFPQPDVVLKLADKPKE
jgi:hypothetical protein